MNSHAKTKGRLISVVFLLALAAAAQNHVLKGTYIDSEDTFVTISAATMTAIGNPITVNCPGTSGTCTIDADLRAQLGGASASGNNFELCLFVDGQRVDPYCFGYDGVVPSDTTYLVGTTAQSKSGLAVGNHTVQAYFWATYGCNVIYRHFTYNLYKP